MTMTLALLRRLQLASPAEAWAELLAHAWSICSPRLHAERAASEVTRRDAELAAADLFLGTAGWDLWRSFEAAVPHTSDALAAWWTERSSGRAILILDALSLREVPWLIEGAVQRGYTIHQARPTCAELPADTVPFAKALGFASRSTLQNNGGTNGRLPGATTDSTDLPWKDCAAQINSSQDWVLWHHWPDVRLHDLSAPGHGLAALAREAADKLTSGAFWELAERLTTGRRLVITSDHGYAASGQFPDTADAAQAQYLKQRFGSRRWIQAPEDGQPGERAWIPPLDLRLDTAHSEAMFVLGRRKWKSQGGYPTLTHGGLTLLEVTVPFIELSRPGER